MIQIKDLTKLYPAKAAGNSTSRKNGKTWSTPGRENGAIHALDRISLHVAKGEWLSIMGPVRIREVDVGESDRMP